MYYHIEDLMKLKEQNNCFIQKTRTKTKQKHCFVSSKKMHKFIDESLNHKICNKSIRWLDFVCSDLCVEKVIIRCGYVQLFSTMLWLVHA